MTGAVLPLLALFMLASCGVKDKAEKELSEAAMEQILKGVTDKNVDVERQGKKLKIKQEGSETTMEETGEWPSDIFPTVPEFTFGKVTRVVKGDDGGRKSFNIYFDDLQEGGIEKYVDMLNKGGWRTSLMSMGSTGGYVTGEKGDLGLQFAFSKERNDGTLIVFSSGGQ